MKYVVIPQSHLDKLEEARKRLWKLVEDEFINVHFAFPITSTMHYITHRKYPKADCQIELDFGE